MKYKNCLGVKNKIFWLEISAIAFWKNLSVNANFLSVAVMGSNTNGWLHRLQLPNLVLPVKLLSASHLTHLSPISVTPD
jgi:hypothetical protein